MMLSAKSMRIKRRYGLKYHDGRYLSWDPQNFPLTHDEFEARKFLNIEEISLFLEASPYRPEAHGLSSEDFEICEFELTCREVEADAHPEGGAQESEIASRDQRS